MSASVRPKETKKRNKPIVEIIRNKEEKRNKGEITFFLAGGNGSIDLSLRRSARIRVKVT